MTDDLIAFLNARLDEDERRADSFHYTYPDTGDSTYMLDQYGECRCGYPARVLREVAFKRAVMAEHYPGTPWGHDAPEGLKICAGEEGDGDTWQMATRWPCPQIRVLAAVYSDHPDYQPGWKL